MIKKVGIKVDLTGKKLLILAGAGIHSKVVRAAKEMGIYTIVTDYLVDSPAKALADESWLIDIKDVDKIVEKCKESGVDGVLNFCIDPAQWPYLEICERLGFPCYATREQLEILTDKVKFKEYCIRARAKQQHKKPHAPPREQAGSSGASPDKSTHRNLAK